MKKYCSGKNFNLYQGNMLDMLEVIEKDSVDSIVCDPPYELNFMSKKWDNKGISFDKNTWQKCYEVLKPGGYLLAFGGSRTYHRIACVIEDAGFEIRDTIMWLYGSGFPKSMNIGLAIDKKNGIESEIIGIGKSGKEETHTNSLNMVKGGFGGEYEIKKAKNDYDGWGTALKPAYEPIIVARKPFKGSCVDNVLKYGVGGINIDECRVEMAQKDKKQYFEKQKSFENANKDVNIYGGFSLQESKTKYYETDVLVEKTLQKGRFPANVILSYGDEDFEEVCGGFPYTKDYGGETKTIPKNDIKFNASKEARITRYNESGSASRYFYCAKASKKDRDEGLEEFEEKRKVGYGYDLGYQNIGEGMFKDIQTLKKNIHPTVKPTELMQYLVRLVSPKNSIILDPFLGSGSTGKAVMYENEERKANYKFIGIELTEEYLPIAKARIEFVCGKEEKEVQMTIDDLIN